MRKLLFSLLVLSLTLAVACSAEPETIIKTVVVETTREVPVTVEITRQVETTVEVIQEVEVTREVPVEVTRIVEVVITATPTPTPEPTATNTPAPIVDTSPSSSAGPSPPAGGVTGALLQASIEVRDAINAFRDGLVGGNCDAVIINQDIFLAAPSFDVSGASSETQWAYGHYQAALELARDAALGIGQGCRDAIANQEGFTITHLNYVDIRGKLDRALQEVNSAIQALES